MDRVEARHRIFEALIVPIAAQGKEILRVAGRAAIFEARRDRPEAAAIDADIAARREMARLAMSTTPAVRSPYWAGRAPSSRFKLPTKPVSRTGPSPETPSGSRMPLIRYWTFAYSFRTWNWDC